jgi:hypothetical protein
MRLECRELGRPERFDLFQPGAKDRETLWAQSVQSDACVVVNAAVFNEATLPQDTEVTTQTRRTDREGSGNVAGALWLPPQQVDHAPPRRIGERQERVVDVGACH